MTLWIVALAQVAVLAAMTLYVVRVVSRARKSKSWPTVQATVLDSRVVGNGKAAKPRIEFAYTVGGRRYTSRRRSVGMPLSVSGSWAAEIVAAFPKGSTVVASVDPRDPAYAVLAPGVGAAHLLMMAVLGGIVLASCVAALTVA